MKALSIYSACSYTFIAHR